MGHSVFLRTQGPPVIQAWLLGAFVILCLRFTIDAIICSDCELQMPGEECKKTCEWKGDYVGCMAWKITRRDGAVEKRQLTCYDIPDFFRCNHSSISHDLRRHDVFCCTNEDYCANKLL